MPPGEYDLAVTLKGGDLWLWSHPGWIIKRYGVHPRHRNGPSPLLKECSNVLWQVEPWMVSAAAAGDLVQTPLRIDGRPKIPKNARSLVSPFLAG